MSIRRGLAFIYNITRSTGRIGYNTSESIFKLHSGSNNGEDYAIICNLFLCTLQDNVAKTISSKKATIARYNGIQQMWIGADYWPIERKWKWRNAYVDFDGNTF